MALDIQRLYTQGRAKSPHELWQPEELDAVLLLERERHLARTVDADHVRNGITTVEAYDKARKAEFVPTKLEDAVKTATDGLKDNGPKAVGAKKGKK